MEKYENIKQVGEGAFGQVFKSKKKETNEYVAIKKVPIDKESGFPFTAIREIKLFKKILNKHIVELKEVLFEDEHLYFVMEYLSYDLAGLIFMGYKFTDGQIKSLVCQLIEGTKAMHERGLVHRDIKASNILINPDGILKLADFGLTREVSGLMTNRVCTLWYRAPELLLGETTYDFKVDAWSIGCVMLELKLGKTPYKGTDEISQIKLIFEDLGLPQEKYKWSDLFKIENFSSDLNSEEIIFKRYGDIFDSESLQLLAGFLCTTSKKRLSVINSFSLPVVLNNKGKYFPLNFEESHEFYTRKGRN